jgi:hypothetical protein
MVRAGMLLAIGFYIAPNPNSGRPLWQEVPLTILGFGIAFGLIFGVFALIKLPGERRLRRRVEAVEAAAGDSPVYGPPVVYAAGARLFGEVQAAWGAADRELLRRISDPDLIRLRVRAKVRRALELSNGKRRALPEDKGRQKVAFDEYWTLSRCGGEWILWSTRNASFRAEYSTEPIVPEAAAHPV